MNALSSNAKILIYSFLALSLIAISYSCKPSEQMIAVTNKSGKDLSNVTIKSSRYQKHPHSRWRKVLKGGSLSTDFIKNGDTQDLLFSGNLNSECLTIGSDSLTLLIYDCMEEEIIKSKKVELIIMPESIKLNH